MSPCCRPPVHLTCVHQVLALRLSDLLELTWEGVLSCGMGKWLTAAVAGAFQNHFWERVLATLSLFLLCLPRAWPQLFHVAGSYPLVREKLGGRNWSYMPCLTPLKLSRVGLQPIIRAAFSSSEAHVIAHRSSILL